MGTRKTQGKINVPILQEYNIGKNVEMIMYNFHDYFDGIIGIKTLQENNLNINFSKMHLTNGEITIPFQYRTDFENQNFEIPSNSIQVCHFNTNIADGTEILTPLINNEAYFIPSTITTVINESVPLEVHNLTNKPIVVSYNIENLAEISIPYVDENFEIFNLEQVTSFESDDYENNPVQLMRTSHLNSEEFDALKQAIKAFPKIFHKPNEKLTFTNQVKHEIKTTDEIPVHTKTYRYPHVHKQEVNSQIKKMLEDNIIRPSCSPWSSPVWIVPKKQDAAGTQKWRMVVDYRKINEKTIEDRYPLPNITDILDRLGRSNYFTTLDLASGFHQVEMHENSIPKTAFNVENGHYEFNRMPFGLKNAPATFQRVMDNVLLGLQNKICLVYMDDIIIFSTSLQEHVKNLKKVFERLEQYNLKIQLDKSEFLHKTVEFLGHVITPNGIKPNPKKIMAIKKFPIPKTVKEIKSFLGLVGYYRKFIKNFAKLTKPMTSCLKKDRKIIHNAEFINSFETCKNVLINDPILQHPDFTKPFLLTTDASNYAIGAVLSQGPVGTDLPIAYASRTLNPAECNYSTIEKELLAIVWATKYFRPYLFGRKFTILSDHKPLQWLFNVKEPSSKLVRWRLKLSEYDYEIKYKKGTLNMNADALSRIPKIQLHAIEKSDPDARLTASDEEFQKKLGDMLKNTPLCNDEIIAKYFSDSKAYMSKPSPKQSEKDEKSQKIKTPESSTMTAKSSNSTETASEKEEPKVQPKRSPKIKILSQIIIPPPPRRKIKESPIKKGSIKEESEKGKTLKIIKKDRCIKIKPASSSDDEQTNSAPSENEQTIHTSMENPILGAPYIKKHVNIFGNQIIFRYSNNNEVRTEIIKLFGTKKRIIFFLPNNPTALQITNLVKEYMPPGIYCLHFLNKTLEPIVLRAVQESFNANSFTLYISNSLLEDITEEDTQKEKIRLYHETKTSHRGITENVAALKKRFYWPNIEKDVQKYVKACEICNKSKYERQPYKIIFKPTPIGTKPFEHLYMDTYTINNQKFLTIIDSFSKFGQASPIITKTAVEITSQLLKYFSDHGIPQKITSDNGTEFKNAIINDLCTLYKIEFHYTTPRNPNSNSPIERFHSTLRESMTSLKLQNPNKSVTDLMTIAILNYNNSTHSTMNYTPFQIIKGDLNYAIPLEQTENTLITDYITSLSESLTNLNREIQEKLLAKQSKSLEQRNKNREPEPELQEPIFVKQFVKNKISPRYDNKTQNRFAKQNVKRQ